MHIMYLLVCRCGRNRERFTLEQEKIVFLKICLYIFGLNLKF